MIFLISYKKSSKFKKRNLMKSRKQLIRSLLNNNLQNQKYVMVVLLYKINKKKKKIKSRSRSKLKCLSKILNLKKMQKVSKKKVINYKLSLKNIQKKIKKIPKKINLKINRILYLKLYQNLKLRTIILMELRLIWQMRNTNNN